MKQGDEKGEQILFHFFFIFRSIPVQLSGVAVCSHVMNTGQCHSKTIRSQYHHSQALQLTVDSFLKRFFAVQITNNR